MSDQVTRYREGTDERECADLYSKLCRYSMAKDASGLERVCAPDYVLIHMTGMRQTRDEYVKAVLDGTLNYYSTDHDSIEVNLASDGTSASIRGRSRVSASVFGNARRMWTLQQDLTAEKRNGTWILAESRASTY